MVSSRAASLELAILFNLKILVTEYHRIVLCKRGMDKLANIFGSGFSTQVQHSPGLDKQKLFESLVISRETKIMKAGTGPGKKLFVDSRFVKD